MVSVLDTLECDKGGEALQFELTYLYEKESLFASEALMCREQFEN